MFGWLRRKPVAPRGPDWIIRTPYATMQGFGVVPRAMINDLRAQGIPCDVTVDGTGTGLAPMYLETPNIEGEVMKTGDHVLYRPSGERWVVAPVGEP